MSKEKRKLYLFPDFGGYAIFMEENAQTMLKSKYESLNRKEKRQIKKNFKVVDANE